MVRMTQRTPEEIARETTAIIARQTEIDHGDAQNWCPDFTEATILAALRSAVEAEREACAKVAEADAATSRRRQWVNEAQRIGWESAALTGDTIAEAIRARGTA